MLPVLILSGGLATRLRPLTERIPKALVPVAEKPFVVHQLEFLRAQKIRRVILCTGYRADQVEAVVGDGAAYGLEVSYSEDGDTLLGTGGAIIKALPLAGSAFFVLYGDSFLPISFSKVESQWRQSHKPALMTVFRNEGQWDSSNVLFEDQTVVEYDKHRPRPGMDYIDYGLAVLSADLFSDCHPAIPFDLADLYHDLSLSRRLAGMEIFERFYEIGSPEGLAEAEAFLSRT